MAENTELETANIVASGDFETGEIDPSAVGDSLNIDNVNGSPRRAVRARPTFIIARGVLRYPSLLFDFLP
jgi:hypothetical protein